MDRLFLAALVPELQGELVGSRVRAVTAWRTGACLSLSLPPPRELVFSVSPKAPGIYRGDEPDIGAEEARTSERFEKSLQGAEIVSFEAGGADRLVLCRLRHLRPSGKARELHLTAEWIGPRAALYLSDAADARILDILSPSRSRLRRGDTYQRPRPLAGGGDIPPSAEAFSSRLRLARQEVDGANDKHVFTRASGFTPLVSEELRRLVHEGMEPGEAFARIVERLGRPEPFLYRRRGASFIDERPAYRLSPIRLHGLTDFEEEGFASFNAAAATALGEARERERACRWHHALSRAIRRGEKKAASLRGKLRSQEARTTSPGELRRRGELLLAGLGRARPMGEGRVRLPDPFDPEGGEAEVPIDPRLSLAANADKLFRQARKAERTEAELEERLGRLQAQVEHWENAALALRDLREVVELEALAEELLPKATAPTRKPNRRGKPARSYRLGPRRFLSAKGNSILVGRSGRSNDELTFRIASPGDLWFHAAGMAGAHVVLRSTPGSRAGDDEIEQAAALAAYFSKGRDAARVEVLVTERRHLRKIKGAPPGLVKVLESRSLRVSPALAKEIAPAPDDEPDGSS